MGYWQKQDSIKNDSLTNDENGRITLNTRTAKICWKIFKFHFTINIIINQSFNAVQFIYFAYTVKVIGKY